MARTPDVLKKTYACRSMGEKSPPKFRGSGHIGEGFQGPIVWDLCKISLLTYETNVLPDPLSTNSLKD